MQSITTKVLAFILWGCAAISLDVVYSQQCVPTYSKYAGDINQIVPSTFDCSDYSMILGYPLPRPNTIRKVDYWSVRWPAHPSPDHKIDVTGYGQNVLGLECWPSFEPPLAANGSWSQRITGRSVVRNGMNNPTCSCIYYAPDV